MRGLVVFVACVLVCGSVALGHGAYPSVVGTLGYQGASVGAVLPGGPVLCSLNVDGSFSGTVSFFDNGSPLTVNAYSSSMTSTTAAVHTMFTGTDLGTVSASMTSYSSGSATVSISCQEATAFNSGTGVNTGNPYVFTATQTFQAATPITIGNGTTSQNITFDGTNIVIGKLKISNSFNMGANPISGVGKLTQQSANDLWGTCTMSAGTSCTINWTYAPTYCTVTPQGSTPVAFSAAISSTTITVTAASSNSLTWMVHCS